jgi:hypothetical protein
MEYMMPWVPLELEDAKAILTDIQKDLPPDHVLVGKPARAVAKNIDGGIYVLFILDDRTTECAVVHVQWDGQRYVARFRHSKTYPSLDDWKRSRMIRDHEATDTDVFGWSSSRRMSRRFFYKAVDIDHSTAVRANIDKQNYTVCPRHWYIDATFCCETCGERFAWPAGEQRVWFEEYKLRVDSCPAICTRCRAKRRKLKSLQQAYDRDVAAARGRASVEDKKRILSLIDQIAEMAKSIPAGMEATRTLLLKQIKKVERASAGDAPTRAAPEK